MADASDDDAMQNDDVTREIKPGISRTGHADGSPPTYEDHRDFATKMHGALAALLGTAGKEPATIGDPRMQVIDKAIAGTKANPDPEYN